MGREREDQEFRISTQVFKQELKAIEVQTFPVEGQERGKPPYQGAVSIIQSPGFDKESPGVKHPPRLDFKIVMCSMKSNIMY